MRLLPAAALVVVLFASCVAPGAGRPPGGSGETPSRSDGAAAASPPGSQPAPSSTARVTGTPTRPAYLMTALTDVRTGETFTLGQFTGKVAIVQAMAVW